MVATVYEFIAMIEERYADRTAFRFWNIDRTQIQSVTYTQFAHDVRRYAAFLRRQGVQRGMHVGVLAGNGYDEVVAMFGIMLAGMVLVPLNPSKSADELRYELELAEVDVLLCDKEVFTRVPEIARMYDGRYYPVNAYTGTQEEMNCSDCIDADALAMIMFTSGTTGRSKGVMHRQRALFVELEPRQTRFMADMVMCPDMSMLLIFPLFHIAGLMFLIISLSCGIMVDMNTAIRYFLQDLQTMKSVFLPAPPMVIDMLGRELLRGKRNAAGSIRVIHAAAATIRAEMMTVLRENGIRITNTYGLTESCAGGMFNTGIRQDKDTSVGNVHQGCGIRIIHGEICLSGDGIMMGYYHDEEATREVLQDGVLHTGDLGYLDDDGYLYITGRSKNLIILSGGENVSPEELEQRLTQCEAIREVLVHQEESHIAATIHCNECDQDMIRGYIDDMNRELPLYKRITRMHFTNQELSRTATNKIKRY